MNTFPISNDEYSVEEISYEDMMAILASQKQVSSDLQRDESDTDAVNDSHSLNKYDDFSQRIAKNAKQQLPDWLLNN